MEVNSKPNNKKHRSIVQATATNTGSQRSPEAQPDRTSKGTTANDQQQQQQQRNDRTSRLQAIDRTSKAHSSTHQHPQFLCHSRTNYKTIHEKPLVQATNAHFLRENNHFLTTSTHEKHSYKPSTHKLTRDPNYTTFRPNKLSETTSY